MSGENTRLRIFQMPAAFGANTNDIEELLRKLSLEAFEVEQTAREHGRPSSAVISTPRG